MTTHWIISIGRPKLPVMLGKAMLTALSRGTTDVPSPISTSRSHCRAVIPGQAAAPAQVRHRTLAGPAGRARSPWLFDDRRVAGEGGAADVAHLVAVEAAGAVHRRAVVPYHEVPAPPGVRVDELALRGVLHQLMQKDPGFRDRPADDRPGMGGEEQRLARGRGVGADQGLAHRPEGGNLLWCQLYKADRLARIDQRVLADEILDLGLGARVECVIGRAHVGELGVGTPGRDDPPGEDRILRGNRPERAVRMPQPVTELEEPHAVFGRHDPAVLVEVGEIGDARAEPLLLVPADVTGGRIALDLAEIASEGELLLIGDVLLAEHEDG